MGGRAGGGASGGMGSRSRGGGQQQPRTRIYKGSKEWKSVEQNANGLFWSAAVDRTQVKGDRKARTCNPTELNIITKIFGHNFSGFTYTRLNEKPNGTE